MLATRLGDVHMSFKSRRRCSCSRVFVSGKYEPTNAHGMGGRASQHLTCPSKWAVWICVFTSILVICSSQESTGKGCGPHEHVAADGNTCLCNVGKVKVRNGCCPSHAITINGSTCECRDGFTWHEDSKICSRTCVRQTTTAEGDTCQMLGDRYLVSVKELSFLNPLVNCSSWSLLPGTPFCLEGSPLPPALPCAQNYTTLSGATCQSVIDWYVLLHDQFEDLNPSVDCSESLEPGTVVCTREAPAPPSPGSAQAPVPSASTSAPLCKKYHTSAGGETCERVMKRFHLSPEVFVALNPDINCSPLPRNSHLCVQAPSSADSQTLPLWKIATVATVAVLSTLLLVFIASSARQRWKKRHAPNSDLEMQPSRGAADGSMNSDAARGKGSFAFDRLRCYSFEQIEKGTRNFKKLIGSGASADVYRAVLEGKEVAVKKLKQNESGTIKEFETEAEQLNTLHSVYLVDLLGYSADPGKPKMLIYEYMPGGSLKNFLYSLDVMIPFSRRMEIALDVARGIEYCHHGVAHPVLHRDIKPGNILLDGNLHAKVADFGLAKLAKVDLMTQRWNDLADVSEESEECVASSEFLPAAIDDGLLSDVHNTTRTIAGTIGYMDPEYLNTGKASSRSDVYSFGVLLLELTMGRKPLAIFASIMRLSNQGSFNVWGRSRSASRSKNFQAPALATSSFKAASRENEQCSFAKWLEVVLKKGPDEARAIVVANLRDEDVTPQQAYEALRIARCCLCAKGADRPTMREVVRLLEPLHPNHQPATSLPWPDSSLRDIRAALAGQGKPSPPVNTSSA